MENFAFNNVNKELLLTLNSRQRFYTAQYRTTWNQVVSKRLNRSTEHEKHLRFPLSGHERNSLLATPPEGKAFIATPFMRHVAIYTE